MLLPYRAKNPPEHFPYVTIGLIAVNVIVFALTSENFFMIREDALNTLAVSHNTMYSEPWRLITSMFLHADLEHILGNMLFLWLFGASVEGRLRPVKYILLYVAAGLFGDLLNDLIFGLNQPDTFSLGASGAIMGVAGAYLYMFAYSSICVFYWFGFIRIGVAEWQARWVVLLYVGLDILMAVLLRGADGVGHLAHIGGFGMGLLLALLFRAQRDTEERSAIQAIHAEAKDYTLLSFNELDTLLQHPTDDMNLVLAYCEKALTTYGGARTDACLRALQQYSGPLFERADPSRLAWTVLQVPPAMGGLPPVFYLRLARQMQSITSNEYAMHLYRRIYDLAPQSPDSEVALYRLGQLMQTVFHNMPQAQAYYTELLRLFPQGQMAWQARQALQQMAYIG